MHRFSSLPPHRACVLALVFVCSLVLSSSPAYADNAMPSVVGKTEAEAVRRLESLGLDVRVVTIAEAPPGRVSAQEPLEGSRVESGDEVLLRVGVRLKIRTLAPRVIGRGEEAVLEGLGAAYDLEVEYVSGSRAFEGRVLRQQPEPGEQVFLRGRFRIEVVRNAVVVPVLVGRLEADARAELDTAGLAGEIRYVKNSRAPRGTVISQDPRSGSEMLPGGVVEVRVAGRSRGTRPTARARVPDVRGLDFPAAEEELLSQGLVPHVHLVDGTGKRDWEVLSQETPPHRQVAAGSSIGLQVAKPKNRAGGIIMPSLYGMTYEAVGHLMEHMGLRTQARRSPSPLAEGTVFRQSAAPGTRLSPGQSVVVDVAGRPPSGWTQPLVQVPDVVGLRPGDAYIELIQMGLRPRLGRGNAPDWKVGHAFTQNPKPGQRVRVGSNVVYSVPFRARVPDLRGRTRTQALEILQAAGLQGLGRMRGPDIPGVSEVIWQEVKHGRVVSRGSLVKFNYRKAPPTSEMRTVPRVVGMSKEAAAAKLVAAGFKVRLRPAAFGNGPTRVVTQSPRAGERLPVGSEVLATYHYDRNTLPELIRVPRVIGMRADQALRKMETLGLNARLVRQGPSTGGVTEVIAQNPLAGNQAPRGAGIVLTYREIPADETYVLVPNVVGKRLDKAMKEIDKAGLKTGFSRVGTHVKSQAPAAGTRVRSGSTVKVKLGF